MAYPEAIPPLSKAEGKDFLQRMANFKLTDAQKEFWANPDQTKVADEKPKGKRGK